MAARDGAQVDGSAQAAHAVRCLPVEELQLPDLGEDLSAPAQEILGDEPEDGDRHCHFGLVQKPMRSCDVHPLHLHTQERSKWSPPVGFSNFFCPSHIKSPQLKGNVFPNLSNFIPTHSVKNS